MFLIRVIKVLNIWCEIQIFCLLFSFSSFCAFIYLFFNLKSNNQIFFIQNNCCYLQQKYYISFYVDDNCKILTLPFSFFKISFFKNLKVILSNL